jgi:predicted TIM-barrel fold metal-dependent hydrolase
MAAGGAEALPIVDAHVHLGGWTSLALLEDKIRTAQDLMSWRTKYPALYEVIRHEEAIDNSDLLIADMDRYGIARAVVMATPGVANEAVAAMVARHPHRLVQMLLVAGREIAEGFPDDTRPVLARALEEIERGVAEFRIRGIGEIIARSFTRSIHPEEMAADLAPLFDAARRHRLPVMVGTAWTQFRGGLHSGDPLYVDEIAAAYPDVTIILSKMGRGIGYYFDMSMAVACRNANVYLDVVGTKPDHLRAAVDAIGAERILFGTDWTHTWRFVREPMPLYPLRLKVVDDAGLTPAQRESILHRNAAAVFGL